MSIAPTQFSRHRRSKSYPPRNPPSSGITFTLSDHFTSCLTLCFTCFPSFSRRPSEESSSDELGFPRDTLDSLLPAFSSEHGNHRDDADDDAAAWGSDALSLRSQFGTSKRSSRERNPRGAWRSWLGRLIAGRGERLSLEVEEGVDDERDFLEDPDRIFIDPTEVYQAKQRTDEEERREEGEGEGEGEAEWGAFLSAPLTRRSPNMTTSTSPSPSSSTLPTARAYPFPTSTSASTHLAEPNIPELEPSSTPGPLASISSSSSSSSASSSESKHRSSRSSKSFNKKKSPPPSNEVEPTPAEDVPPSV